MRVTLLGTLPPLRGISPYCSHLLEALASRDDVEVDFLGFRRLYPGRLYPGGRQWEPGPASPVAHGGVAIRNMLAWHDPLSWMRAGLTLEGQIVHAQWWSYPLAPVFVVVLALARRRGRRVVLTLHNVEPHESGAWRRFASAAVLRFADHFIVHAEQNRLALERKLGSDGAGRISVAAMGVQAPDAAKGPWPAEGKALLGLPGDHAVVLYFGNIRPYKGLDVLLRAFAGVRDEMEKVKLLVAGQPWPASAGWEPYRRLIDSLGLAAHVLAFPRYVPPAAVERLFAAADLVVLPYTHFDAQSAAGTLALTFGKPLLVTDVGGLPELVRHPAAVVTPRNPEALRDAILRVLCDDRLRVALAADSRALAETYRWDEVARRTVEVYRRVLAPSPAGSMVAPLPQKS